MGELIFEVLAVTSTLAVNGLALLKGDQPERYGATIMFVAWVSSNLAMDMQGQGLDVVTLTNVLFAIDVVVLISLGGLAWMSRRAWAVIALLLQMLQVFIHIARDMGLPIDRMTYFYALTISGYGQLVAILVGTVIAWRERDALASFGIVVQPDAANSPAKARSMSASVFSTPKIATKDPNRGPWF